MATFDSDDQVLFNEALAAALATEEIRAGMRLTGVTEIQLRQHASEAKDGIWQAVASEQRRRRDLLRRMAKAQDRPRITPSLRPVEAELDEYAGALLKQAEELYEQLRESANYLLRVPVSEVQSSYVQEARSGVAAFGELIRNIKGIRHRRNLGPSDRSDLLQEITRQILEQLDVTILTLEEKERGTRQVEPEDLVRTVRGAGYALEQILEEFPRAHDEVMALATEPDKPDVRDREVLRLRDQVAAATDALVDALRDRVLSALREFINQQQAEQVRLWVEVPELAAGIPMPELAEVAKLDPGEFVVTEAARRLEDLLERMPGASIGIAGPRGSGKTTLIEHFCGDPAMTRPGLRLKVSAPVEYFPRDFVLHLFAKLCRTVLVKAGHTPDDVLDPGADVPRLWRVATQSTGPADLLLGAAGVVLLAWHLAHGGLATEDATEATGTGLILASVVLALVAWPAANRFLGVIESRLARLVRVVPPWFGIFALMVATGAAVLLLPHAGIMPAPALVGALGMLVVGLMLLAAAGGHVTRVTSPTTDSDPLTRARLRMDPAYGQD